MIDDAEHRAFRWKAFYEEEGGLGEMVEGLRRAYFERHGELKITQKEERYALALADKILRELDGMFKNAADAQSIQAQREHARKVEAIPPFMRRYI
jgi:hypothetical protein